MENKRKLIDYLPPFMREFREMSCLMASEQEEINRVISASEDVLNDQFIMTATERGISRWESTLGIKPKGTATLEERRFAVIARMNRELPYTVTKLNETLTTICGAGNFDVKVYPNEYHVEVKLALANQNHYQEVVDLLTTMIPANLTYTVQILFNTNSVLSKFKHSELVNYTHDTLRKEVALNE